MGLFLAPPKPLNEKAADVLQEMLEMLFIFLERCHFLAESEKKNNPPRGRVTLEAPTLLQSLSFLGRWGNLIPRRRKT